MPFDDAVTSRYWSSAVSDGTDLQLGSAWVQPGSEKQNASPFWDKVRSTVHTFAESLPAQPRRLYEPK